MDPNNAVIALCTRGMRAESEGRDADARDLFDQAWQAADDDYEACVAAHYLARHQTRPEDVLAWNQECLDRAERVGDERVAGFFGSLHLNMGGAYTTLGEADRAAEHLRRAAETINDIPAGAYQDWIRYAVAEGLRRADRAADPVADEDMVGLIKAVCGRADLMALALVLPAYVGNLGHSADRERLVEALRMLHASRRLPDDEQDALVGMLDRLTSGGTAPA